MYWDRRGRRSEQTTEDRDLQDHGLEMVWGQDRKLSMDYTFLTRETRVEGLDVRGRTGRQKTLRTKGES